MSIAEAEQEQSQHPQPGLEMAIPSEAPFNDTASVETWYRNLRPDTDIRTVNTGLLVEAVAVSVLDTIREDVPVSTTERSRSLLSFTTNSESLAHKVAAEGYKGLVVGDLIFELCSNMGDMQPLLQDKLTDFGASVSLKIRDNTYLAPEKRLQAAKTLTNLQQSKIRRLYENGVLGNTADKALTDTERSRLFSDLTIKNIQAEALWISTHSGNAKAGNLFETLVGSLAKFSIWEQELETEEFARHATLREDSPSKKIDGGSGFELAHDVVIVANGVPLPIQCKIGDGSNENKTKYDESKVEFIAETAEDGVLDSNQKMIDVFTAIAQYDKSDNLDIVDAMIKRYKLADLSERHAHKDAHKTRVVEGLGIVSGNQLKAS